MKKYLFGTFAIALAIAFSAFTAKPLTSTFSYAPTNDVSWSAITNTLNYSTSESVLCDDGDLIPCEVIVDQSTIQAFVNYLTANYSNNHAAGEAFFLTKAGRFKANP